MSVIEVPVLIVGGGPVGLGLALDLGGRGIECLVIEKLADIEAGIKINPRAAAITPRTMEFCRRWGVAKAVHNAGFPEDYALNLVYCTSLDGHTIAVNKFPSMKDRIPHPVSPETRERCPQIWFDPILAAGLAQFPGCRFEMHWQLEAFEDKGTHVTAQIRNLDTGDLQIVECTYLAACDGSASIVRTALGVETEGTGSLGYAVNVVLDIPDFMSLHKKGTAERYYFIDHRGVWSLLTVIDGRERWRFGIMGTLDPSELANVDVEAAMARALGPHVKYEIVAHAPWHRRESIARRFRIGRVFLAGDAAHAMGPDLGLGMNTGAADSFDLGWKIEATMRGWGGAGLLDSYEAERRPAAIRNAEASTKTYRRLVMPGDSAQHVLEENPRGEEARKAVGAQLLSVLKEGWDTIGLAMGYRYENSPICVPDGSPPPVEKGFADYVQSSRPGGRAPHAWLAAGRSTIDLFGNGFVLMRAEDVDVAGIRDAAGERGVPLSVVDITDPAIKALYQDALVLVRPDGHVAWRSNHSPSEPLQLIDKVRGAEL
ncbi:MAG TPA: FAD-dependent monooxygenase [Stellaceae bacterium]|jgi:2-polyprenyl-6-methoxyphenol hydroxylase-like FAD-dependent oxidoreductase|nr:FAD-dependent monooxygenase [Stellaceae bacterium]